jgi:GNAT superfamily N-acetyltransferase
MSHKERAAEVLDAFSNGLVDDAAELVFDYMAATCAEVGWAVPASPSELPEPLRREVNDLVGAYAAPGTFLVCYRRGHPIGGVGLQMREQATAEVKRLYVRPPERGGVGRLLMETLAARASRVGIRRLVLDVLPTRIHVIEFYQRLGYVQTEPYAVEPVPMVSMEFVFGADHSPR